MTTEIAVVPHQAQQDASAAKMKVSQCANQLSNNVVGFLFVSTQDTPLNDHWKSLQRFVWKNTRKIADILLKQKFSSKPWEKSLLYKTKKHTRKERDQHERCFLSYIEFLKLLVISSQESESLSTKDSRTRNVKIGNLIFIAFYSTSKTKLKSMME